MISSGGRHSRVPRGDQQERLSLSRREDPLSLWKCQAIEPALGTGRRRRLDSRATKSALAWELDRELDWDVPEDRLCRAGRLGRFSTPAAACCTPTPGRGSIRRPGVQQGRPAAPQLYDLKHTRVAFLTAGGVDLSEIQRRAGHSSVAFT